MGEERFFKIPSGKESNLYVRKKADLEGELFTQKLENWERGVKDGEGEAMKILKEYEVEKSPEQERVLDVVVEELEKVVKNYGMDRLDISKNPVFLLKDDFWEKYGFSKEIKGHCFENIQQVAIRATKNLTKTELATFAYHELLHLASFRRYSISNETHPEYPEFSDLRPERSGVLIVNGSDILHQYFFYLNEAITAKLEYQFIQRIRNYPDFKDEYVIIDEQFGSAGKKAHCLRVDIDEQGEKKYYRVTTYEDEKEELDNLIKEVWEKNKNEFSSEDEVFAVFIKTYFTGKLLPLARLLEKTFGKGFFRELGEKTSKKFEIKKKKNKYEKYSAN